MLKKLINFLFFCFILQSSLFADSKELTILAGAGLKKPLTEISKVFEETNSIKINFTYGGSGQLVSQLELTQKGDLFIVGSLPVYKMSQSKNLVQAPISIAYHTPVIAVQKNNPKNIHSLKDLTMDNLKLILGDSKANAIGKTAQDIFKKNNLETINKNVISTGATVSEMIVQFENSNGDAMIVTRDSIFGNNNVELIPISPEENIDQVISGGLITSSQNKELAQNFLKFVISTQGQNIFRKYGFEPIQQ